MRSVPNPPPVYLPFPHNQQQRHPQVHTETVHTDTCPSLINSSCVTHRYKLKLYTQLPALLSSTAVASPTGTNCTHSYLPFLISSSCVTHRYTLYAQLPAPPSSAAAASPIGTNCTHSCLLLPLQKQLRHPQVHTVHTATCSSLISSSCVTHR